MYARPRLALPVPRSPETARQLAEECRRLITTRVRLRHEAAALVGGIGAA